MDWLWLLSYAPVRGKGPAPKEGWPVASSRLVPLSAKPKLLLFSFLLFLPFYRLAYHLLVQAHRAHAVAQGQKWLPPYRFCRKSRNVLNTRIALLPLSRPIYSLIDRTHSSTSSLIFPATTRKRYFGTHTMWYSQCQVVCDCFLNLLMVFPFCSLWDNAQQGWPGADSPSSRAISLTTC